MFIAKYKILNSTFDKAFDLADAGSLKIWDSVQAQMQTHGRGQMRSHWVSLEGNVFASIRLPYTQPFTGSAGAVTVGALCVEALREHDCPIYLKWPNDLVIRQSESWCKVGGILLEERNGILVAGIGLNLTSFPAIHELDMANALRPAAIGQICSSVEQAGAITVWQQMANFMHSFCQKNDLRSTWEELAMNWMIWRNEEVCVEDLQRRVCGVFLGISEDGACILDTVEGRQILDHGTMRLHQDNFQS